ncbi:MAG TPA: hypothetical protein VKB27_09505 [Gammaproteobacteria bacterium]|nr:hypothetical protein [Gammaproteobacteria bacterium]
MSGTKKPAVADCEEDSDSTVTQLNTDITENLKSLPEGSLGAHERRRLREALEREQAARGKRWSIFRFLFDSGSES